jgi:hypothetical protein
MIRHLLIAAVAAATATASGAQMGGDMSRQQASQFAAMMFQRFDLNHDGVVTRQEVDQARGKTGSERPHGHTDRMVARMFGDSQSITLAQAQAQALARFDAQDLNHDGVVTAAERDQARAERHSSR